MARFSVQMISFRSSPALDHVPEYRAASQRSSVQCLSSVLGGGVSLGIMGAPMKNIVVVVALLLLWSPSYAFEQTFETCSIDAWKFFNSIQNYILGVPLEKLKARPGIPQSEVEYLDFVYNLVKTKGIEHAYMLGHVLFYKCSKTVAQKKLSTSLSQKGDAYQECASKSTTRTT